MYPTIFKFIFILVTLTLFISCEKSNTFHIDGMKLNNTQKWKMDEHTKDMFKEMTFTFKQSNNNLDTLGVKINKQLDSLINGCTMVGAAHDQLHVYLTTYIPEVRTMLSLENIKDKKKQAKKVKNILEVYDDYFE